MALTKILTEGIKDGEILNVDIDDNASIAKSKLASLNILNTDVNASAGIVSSKLAKPIDFADSEKARFGTGNDLQIYHDGNHSRIVDTNTNILSIQSAGGTVIHNAAADEFMAKFLDNGACELYYDNSKKFQTDANGVKLFGRLRMEDNIKAEFGSSEDLQIYHDGSDSYLKHNGTGNFYVQTTEASVEDLYLQAGNDVYIRVQTGDTAIKAIGDGAVELYYNNGKKFETTSGGAKITGILSSSITSGQAISLADNAQIHLGTGDDLQIYHDGTYNRIAANAQIFLQNKTASETYIAAYENGAVELYYDGNKICETIAAGLKVQRTTATSTYIELETSGGIAGYLYGQNNNQIQLMDREGHAFVKCVKDGSVELYHDNTKRFETYNSPAGTYITGRAHVQCQADSICQHNLTTNSSGAYHQESLGASGATIAYVGHSPHLCGSPTTGNYAIRFEGSGLEFAKSSVIQARITSHGGIAFGADTAAQNTLDDYEEGTWTPTVHVGAVTSGSDALTYSGQQGWYVKIGAFVQASFYILFNAMGDGNNFVMAGLPYTTVNLTPSYSSSGVLGYQDCNFTNNATQMLYLGNNASAIYYYNNSSGTHSPASTKLVSTERVASSLYGTVTYRVS